jgi:hypothetical protein
MPDVTSKPLIQNGSIMLDPAPNGGVVDRQAAFRHHFFQVAVAERVPRIPPDAQDAQDDNHVLKVSPPEQHRAVLAHRLTVPNRLAAFATDPPSYHCPTAPAS